MIVHHPFAYSIGWFSFTGFGIAVLLAFVIAQIISQRELARRGHNPEPIADLIFAAVFGGLAGAKIYYFFLTGDPRDLISRGGFVFWGGLAGGILAVLLVIKLKHLRVQRIADVAGIAIAAAYAMGRTGCWAVGDDYGRPWHSRFAVAFPQGAPPSTAGDMAAQFHLAIPAGVAPSTVLSVYPTQLFEITLGFIMFLILWRLRDHKHAEGWLFGVYMVLAGLERFLIEFLRAKDDRFFGTLTMAQLIALAAVLGGVIWMRARRTVTERAPGIYATAT
ncbi:MAG TPA: prolipoprotein diacylglyceryl transferase family protein [Gemmatimonadaceae bacterium]|nr:prolipoprotein diacylglyceryl transferase family protein [Gemmatimonadaceae bacterium]